MSAIRENLFRYRSYTPIPFVIAMLALAEPTDTTMLWGALTAVAGEALRFWGVAYAGSLTRVTGSVGAPEVIVAGPFAHVRNPLYVGNILLYVGVGIMANAWAPWLTLAAAAYFVFQYSMIVSLEEEFLEQQFGASYLEYKRSVPRFLLRVSPYRTQAQEHQRPDWKGALRSERRTLQAIVIMAALLLYLWWKG